jgi:transposase-like protein
MPRGQRRSFPPEFKAKLTREYVAEYECAVELLIVQHQVAIDEGGVRGPRAASP